MVSSGKSQTGFRKAWKYFVFNHWIFCKEAGTYQNAMVPASIQIETYPFPIIRLADLYLLYAEALNEAKKEEAQCLRIAILT